MTFPFSLLPTELALEIIRVAALPSYEDITSPRPSYATAVSMASVSHAMRTACMPHLLHSVVLVSSIEVLCFIDAVHLQKQLSAISSPLTLDYYKLVRRFWSTECWEPLMDHPSDYSPDYGTLYEIIRGADSLGLNFRSLNILYNGLSSSGADPARDWKCSRVTFAGLLSRWRPLTSNSEGLAFLSHVTHLTLWIPTHDDEPHSAQTSPVPGWIADVPFAAFRNLTHLAFPLLSNPLRIPREGSRHFYHVPMVVLVYVAPRNSVDFKPTMFREWAMSANPLSYGFVVPFRVLPGCAGETPDLSWEIPFMQGEADDAWAEVDRLGESRTDDMDCGQ